MPEMRSYPQDSGRRSDEIGIGLAKQRASRAEVRPPQLGVHSGEQSCRRDIEFQPTALAELEVEFLELAGHQRALHHHKAQKILEGDLTLYRE